MTVNLVGRVVTNEARPGRIDWLNFALTIARHLDDFPVAKRRACVFKEKIRSMWVDTVLKFAERIVRCSSNFAINDIALFVGRELEQQNITLERSGDSGRWVGTEGR